MIFVLCAALWLIQPVRIGMAAQIKETSPDGHQAIKARIVDPSPQNFTISVNSFSNMWADDNAPTFAIYTSYSVPKLCADFTKLKLTYQKPTKYRRVFNLSKHKEVLKALEKYQCVVVRNIQH